MRTGGKQMHNSNTGMYQRSGLFFAVSTARIMQDLYNLISKQAVIRLFSWIYTIKMNQIYQYPSFLSLTSLFFSAIIQI